MTGYAVRIEVPEGRIKKIMERMDKAQHEIYECYSELENLGVLKVVPDEKAEKEAASD